MWQVGKLRHREGMQCAQAHTVSTSVFTRNLPPQEDKQPHKTRQTQDPTHDWLQDTRIPSPEGCGPALPLFLPRTIPSPQRLTSSVTFIQSWHGSANTNT